MQAARTPAMLVRLRPAGPWRIGPATGARDSVDRVFHSDTLYSALCAAMARLEQLDEWLDATARRGGDSSVRPASLFPHLGELLFVPPPMSLWPPPPAAKIRWKSASLVPIDVVRGLVAGVCPDESRWVIDPISECLLPLEKTVPEGPFRICHRAGAATDRLAEGRIAAHSIAALEFSENAGWWTVFSFADAAAHDRWRRPLEAAFHLLADSGLGGERSRGWGCFSIAGIQDGHLPDLILPEASPPSGEEPASDAVANTHPRGQAWWLLGLLVPGAGDEINWKSGHYSLTTRGGRVESAAGWGIEKKQLRMLAEGSVVECGATPGGSAPDVAPDGFPHPVFRAGFGLALPVPLRISS